MITIRKGFTLIELLVVIAIIAILAAILFPVFAQAREKARQANCLSNLKNIGTAVMMYIDDYNQTYPMAYGATPTYSMSFWPGKIFTYTKNWNIFYCPSYWTSYDSSITDDFGAYNTSNQAYAALGGGYTANPHMLAYPENGYPGPIKQARVKSPSNCVMIYEGSNWCEDDAAWANNGAYNCYLPGQGLAGVSTSLTGDRLSEFNNGRHNEGIILAYADGHASFEKSTTVYSWMNTTSKNPMRPTTW